MSLRIGTGTESTEALLLSGEQVPGEELVEGQHVKVYVVDVRRSTRGPQILISRTTPAWSSACSSWRSPRSMTAPWR